MDAQFWIKAWNDGRTNFHKSSFNEKLLEYFPQFHPLEGQKVLVPLCGKTKDLVWLSSQKLKIHGVELYENPVKEFFVENNLPDATITKDKDFVNYTYQNLTISCGDFFKLTPQVSYDFIYDRASLVALPAQMRKDYAQLIKQVLKVGGKYLLLAYEYDQSKMEGPPFSVTEKEIHDLYEDSFSIKRMDEKRPDDGPRLATLETIVQRVYILEKLR
jgi:thiopurine S-methyltransferase